MEYLLKRINNEMNIKKEYFSFYKENKEFRLHTNVYILLDVITAIYPQYFNVTSDNSIIVDANFTKDCGFRNASTIPRITNGYSISTEAQNSIVLQDPNNLQLLLNRKTDTVLLCRKMDKSLVASCPEGFIFVPGELSEAKKLKKYAKKHKNSTWIYKPDGGSKGKGISINDNVKALVSYAKKNENKTNSIHNRDALGGVIQEFVNNPLLYNEKRRFSLRIYALQTSNDPFIGYLSQKDYNALLASEHPDDNFGDLITNYHHHMFEYNIRSTYVFHEFLIKYGLMDTWIDYTLPAIGMGLYELLRYQNTIKVSNQTIFDLYGCDILLDTSMKPWILECNRCPGVVKDLKTKVTLYEEMIYILLHQEFFGKDEIPPNLKYWGRLNNINLRV